MARRSGRRETDEDPEDMPPWLDMADEPARGGALVSGRRLLFGGLLFMALLAGILLGARYLIERSDRVQLAGRASGEVPLIRAPEGPYKRRPDSAGGLTVEGLDQTIYAAGGGVDPGGEIAFDAVAEEPLPRPSDAGTREDFAGSGAVSDGDRQAGAGGPGASGGRGEAVDLLPPGFGQQGPATDAPPSLDPGAPVGAAAPGQAVARQTPGPGMSRPSAVPAAPVRPPDAAGAPASSRQASAAEGASGPGSTGGTAGIALQLGAFSSRAKADAAWKHLTARYAYLAGLGKSVQQVDREGDSLYRLRAVGIGSRADADGLCARLKVAGEACIVAE